jgi:hypothetical protein
MTDTITASQLASILIKKGLLNASEVAAIKEEILVPLSIFSGNLTSLGALTTYLSHIKKMTIKEIASSLSRNYSSIKRVHSLSPPENLVITKETGFIPLDFFEQYSFLSISECVVYFMKQKKYRNIDIAKTLGKDPRTIWTFDKRLRGKIRK